MPPVAARVSRKTWRARFVWRQAGQAVGGLARADRAVQFVYLTQDAKRLVRVWEPDLLSSGSNDLDEASLHAAVPAVILAVVRGERPLEQGLDLGQGAWLVAFDRKDVVRLLLDQKLGMVPLGMQRVRGHDRAFQVHILQQQAELGDLVGLVIDLALRDDNGLLVRSRGQQVHRPPVRLLRAAYALAVHRDRDRLAVDAPGGYLPCQPGAYRRVQLVRIDGLDALRSVASHGATRRPVTGWQRTSRRAGACWDSSPAYSPIAAKLRAPASVAAAATAHTEARRWRTPRRCRGSGSRSSTASRPSGPSNSTTLRSITGLLSLGQLSSG